MLQHMLFLGTKKYPDENSYSAYLNKHGGWSNAYTASEDTNYFFELQHEHLEVRGMSVAGCPGDAHPPRG